MYITIEEVDNGYIVHKTTQRYDSTVFKKVFSTYKEVLDFLR